jgi:hypothetical protein
LHSARPDFILPEASLLGYIGEGSVAIIAKEVVLSEIGALSKRVPDSTKMSIHPSLS